MNKSLALRAHTYIHGLGLRLTLGVYRNPTQLMRTFQAPLSTSAGTGIEAYLSETTAAPVSAAPAVDLRVLAEFVGDDPVITGEVLKAFRRNAVASSGQLETAVGAGAFQAVVDVTHRVKSAARAVGATRLADLYAELEAAAAARRGNELKRLLPQLQAELEAVYAFLDALASA